MEETWEKIKKELEKINKNDKIMIFHDIDADGISATALLSKYLKDKEVKQVHYYYLKKGKRRIDESLITILNKEKYNYFFILDIAGDEFPKELSRINAKSIIIDHHMMHPFPEQLANMLILKPQIIGYKKDPSTYPTSWLTYNLLESLTPKAKNWEWIGVLGLIGDNALKHWEEKISIQNLNDLHILEQYISFAIAENVNKVDEVRENLINTESYYSLLHKYKKYEYLLNELKKLIEECLRNKEESNNYLLCKVSSKYELKSILANEISKKYPSKTIIIVYDKGEEYYYLSFRNQSFKVPLGEVVKKACEKLGKKYAQGGGHIPAAGAVIKKEKYEEFIKILKDILINIYNF